MHNYSNNLVIGCTSQLSQYFPNTYTKISSRDISDDIFQQEWDRVYLCFGEHRTYNQQSQLFNDINYSYTKSIIDSIRAKTVIYYATAELWNNVNGPIDLTMDFKYCKSEYIESKEKITEYIKQSTNNVLIAYPFNFNSIYRSNMFLIGKVIDSIINHRKIEIGDTHFYRELLHPSFVVDRSILMTQDEIIGTGKLIYVNSFIRNLYDEFDMDYSKYVTERIEKHSIYRQNMFYYSDKIKYNENALVTITAKEIRDKITSARPEHTGWIE